MTTNKHDQIAEDQAFIDSLYEQLEEDQTQGPSDALDKRILTAAHQAVSAKSPAALPHLHQPINKSSHKVAWFYPTSLAASVLLLLGLVSSQLDGPFVGQAAHEMAAVTFDEKESNLQAPLLASSTPIEPIEMSMMGAEPLTLQDEPALLAMAETLPESALYDLPMANKKMAKVMPVTRSQSKQPIQTTQLTPALFLVLTSLSKERPIFWSLINESKSSYVIKVFKTDNTTNTTEELHYELAKTEFVLDLTGEQTLKALPLITIKQ